MSERLGWDQEDWDVVSGELGWCQRDWHGNRRTGRMGLYSVTVQLTWVLMFRVKNRLRY